MKLSELQRSRVQQTLEIFSEGIVVLISNLFDNGVYAVVCLDKQGTGVLYADILQIGLEGNANQLLEFSAGIGHIHMPFLAYLTEGNVLHIVLIYIVLYGNDCVSWAELLGEHLLCCLYEDKRDITIQGISVARLLENVGLPSTLEKSSNTFVTVIIGAVGNGAVEGGQVYVGKHRLEQIIEGLVLVKGGINEGGLEEEICNVEVR